MRCRAAAQASKASKTRSQVSEKLRGHLERSCTYGGSCLARTGGMTKRLLLLCCFATGCSMYWGGDDVKNDDCTDVGYGAAPASQYYRDPSTGTCIAEGGGYYCGCGQPCPDNAGVGVAYPDWGQCYTSCDNLDEADCITTSGCHAAYVETILGAPVSTHTFYGCWQTSPSGNTGGACSGLDAYSCSAHRCRRTRSSAVGRSHLWVETSRTSAADSMRSRALRATTARWSTPAIKEPRKTSSAASTRLRRRPIRANARELCSAAWDHRRARRTPRPASRTVAGRASAFRTRNAAVRIRVSATQR